MITYSGDKTSQRDGGNEVGRSDSDAVADDASMDAVFHALAHTVRRAILDHLRASPGITVGELARNFDVSRIAVMNHLTVLEKAAMVISEKDGRTRRLYLNALPIQEIYERWTDTYSAHWAERANAIKQIAEAAARQLKGEENND